MLPGCMWQAAIWTYKKTVVKLSKKAEEKKEIKFKCGNLFKYLTNLLDKYPGHVEFRTTNYRCLRDPHQCEM